MPKSMDQKRAEAAARRDRNAEKYLHFVERAKQANSQAGVNYWTRQAERAHQDATNARAKLRSRPATFVPWHERSDPIVPGQQ